MQEIIHQAAPVAAVRERSAPLAWLRTNLLAIDVCVIGFLALLIGWTLLSMVAPGARLYPYDDRFAWAEMPRLGLLAQLVAFLAGYIALQRMGIRYHRRHVIGGLPAPRWLAGLHLAHVLSPVLMLPLVFNMLGAFIAGVSGAPAPDTHADFVPGAVYDHAATWWDFQLKRADVAIAGVYPPEWARQFHAPWLTGILMLCYLAYYVSPLVATGPSLARRDWIQTRKASGIFVGTLLLTYVGYIAIPATGPRFEGTFAAWMITERGWFGALWWQHVLDDAEAIRWDAFPSGHVAVSFIALLLAARYTPKIAWVYAPLCVGLVAATVFFGYHYVTDVIAGFGFMALGALIVWPVVEWWDGGSNAVSTAPDASNVP
jgi:membrane-associated phospholipid phosphatase